MTNTLKTSYQKTPYKLGGNGPRNVGVLTEALQNIDDNLESDIYGNGAVIEDFETKIAKILGKQSAVFFPSGTMAQQIALRIWADRKENRCVAYHPLSHLEIHEQDGLKELQQITPILLGTSNRLLTIDDIKSLREPVSSVLIELPQREIGGQLPAFEELEEISEYCHEQGISCILTGHGYGKSRRFIRSLRKKFARCLIVCMCRFTKELAGLLGRFWLGMMILCKRRKSGNGGMAGI